MLIRCWPQPFNSLPTESTTRYPIPPLDCTGRLTIWIIPRSKRLFGRGSIRSCPILSLDCTGCVWLGCGYQLRGSKDCTRLHYRRGDHRHIVVFGHHRSRYIRWRMDFDSLGGALVATAFAPGLEGHSFAVLWHGCRRANSLQIGWSMGKPAQSRWRGTSKSPIGTPKDVFEKSDDSWPSGIVLFRYGAVCHLFCNLGGVNSIFWKKRKNRPVSRKTRRELMPFQVGRSNKVALISPIQATNRSGINGKKSFKLMAWGLV